MRILRLLALVLTLTLALHVFAAPAFAGSGKAIVPPAATMYAGTTNYTSLRLNLSNISENTVEVTLKLRDQNGTMVYEHDTTTPADDNGDLLAEFTSGTYAEADDDADAFTMTFELDGKESCTLTYYPKTSSSGSQIVTYGTLEWENKESTENDQVALIAAGHRLNLDQPAGADTQKSLYNLSINNGVPF
jgi:hypothetical protein